MIRCPKCGGFDSKVVDSRATIIALSDGKDSYATRRRRQCIKCSTRFSTIETYHEEVTQTKTRKELTHRLQLLQWKEENKK